MFELAAMPQYGDIWRQLFPNERYNSNDMIVIQASSDVARDASAFNKNTGVNVHAKAAYEWVYAHQDCGNYGTARNCRAGENSANRLGLDNAYSQRHRVTATRQCGDTKSRRLPTNRDVLAKWPLRAGQ